MSVHKRLVNWMVLSIALLSGLVIACTSEPTATSAPPAATSAPAQAAASDTPVPPAATVAPPAATSAPPQVPTTAPTTVPEPTAIPEAMMPDVPEEAMAIFKTAPSDLLTVVLNEDNGSGQTGWATLTAKGDQTEIILLLPPGALETESTHIHSGRCGADTLGGVVDPLTSFVDGAGFSVTTLNVKMSSLLNGDFAINTHKKGEGNVYTSCGNIPIKAESITIALDAQNDSGQSGLATLTARGTITEVVAFLSPGTLESEKFHIHSGQCGADTLGGVVHPLSSFVGGFGPSVSSIDTTLNSVQTGNFALNSHKAGEPSVYTACGNIDRNFDTITVNLNEDNSSGQSGTALLTPRGGNTEVWLSLSPGALESEKVHIHSGQCGVDTLGGVVYPLTSFSEGISGTLLKGVSISSLLTGDFAVNSHKAGDPSVYTACGNIPGTDVAIVARDFSFSVGEIVVQAGQPITMSLSNEGEQSHNIFFYSFDDQAAKNERAHRLAGGESRIRQRTFDRPGIYPFYCAVARGFHQNAGMIGVLRVLGSSDGGQPSITLNAPSTARELRGATILYGASVTNFNIAADDPNSGKVKVALDGIDLGSRSSILGALANLAQGVYELTAELINYDGTSLDSPVKSTITFTVDEKTETPQGNPTFGTNRIADLPTVVVGQ